MTDQEREIQRVISYIRSCRDAGIDTTITIDKTRNHFILNALEEIQQYRAIGTVEELQESKRFLDFLCDTINPNDMEKYFSMYHATGEKSGNQEV